MSRLKTIDPAAAKGQVKTLLEGVQKKLGKTPNMMRALGNSEAALGGYLAFSQALSQGALSAKAREQIALAVGRQNGCDYCVSAHSALGKSAGLSPARPSRRPSRHHGSMPPCR